ncbi:hypothetical protein ACET3X_010008 [Alternaria dauci]|uniref:Zn(2)-C6 fungal-type domain-containing protein n=1 Tax=Alternaria dauci TaxID=48095 RepID=A0ABR3U831_9PLEO
MTLQPASESVELGDDGALPEDDGIGDDEEHGTIHNFEGPVSKVACDRCRRRKIKCSRQDPCAQCLRASLQCTFPEIQNREKRQRILISSLYESKIEHINQKLDELTCLVQRLEVRPDRTFSKPGAMASDLHEVMRSSPSFQKSVPDHEGIDISLLVNVLQVADLLETALNNRNIGDQSSTVADIQSCRRTLQNALGSQSRRSSQNEGPPFARSLLTGLIPREVPLPTIDKVMACLRMAQDHGTTTVPWLGETKSFGDFTLIIVQVCSPGSITDVELIIALSGLYWMFTMCTMWADPDTRGDLKEQADLCQNSLETVLSALNFWLPTTVDAVLAMNLASLYCLQKGKIYACWTFINKAVMLGQALGLHQNNVSSGLSPEERHRRFCLFWSTYCLERPTALRLARPSTIRDQHITIPKPEQYPTLHGLNSSRQSLIHAVEMSRLYGRAYDDLFSPSALALPAAHRITHAQAIAAEWCGLIASKESSMAQWHEDTRGTIGEFMPVEFAQHATRATDHLLLVAINRVAFSQPSPKIPTECIAAARTSLHEHTQCVALLVSYKNDPAMFELWINGGLILFPFVPFDIIFCNIIENANLDDLESLNDFINALESLSKNPEYISCTKQLEIFQALYKLAAVHIKFRAHIQPSHYPPSQTSSSWKDAELERLPNTLAGLAPMRDHDGTWNGSIDTTTVPSILDSQPWTDFGGMDLDPLGTQLGYWIQESGEAFDSLDNT